ncbi:hypothetical protein OBBRIDRAFT_391097 [Obba rivulosa]|uniref:Uncharacterized protein n=1 Tax=Obba rivulosa TaxID=1052685 RepID=A0A8E2DF97_9APHY|nr:hypothetical protein OBBRIDRAFT_391097 [Obba rivulosa]
MERPLNHMQSGLRVDTDDGRRQTLTKPLLTYLGHSQCCRRPMLLRAKRDGCCRLFSPWQRNIASGISTLTVLLVVFSNLNNQAIFTGFSETSCTIPSTSPRHAQTISGLD